MADSYAPTPIPVPGMAQPPPPPPLPLPPPPPLLPVMGMSQKEYQTAFMHLDYANFAREAEEFDARPAGSLLLPPLPWYKRPEFWAIIIGTFSLTHGFFIQWIWPKIKQHLTEESPYSPRRICEEEL